MHPAFSIIWFTSLSGAGYGLVAFLGLGIAPVWGLTALIAYGIAFALIGIGLISSTLHLGHPERAWRAFSQWRSSWLSREGVLALVTFIPMSICAIYAVFFNQDFPAVGVIVAILSACTVYATSMIYASLRTIHQWYSWLTSACYLGFAASSGYLLFTVLCWSLFDTHAETVFAMILLGLAWAFKGLYWHRADTSASASTVHSALGLAEGTNPRRLEVPHTGTNYLMKEMGYQVARKHAQKLRAIAVTLGFVIPILCLFVSTLLTGSSAQLFAGLAALTHFTGIVVERWLFFAQARHTVMLYYGATFA